MKMVLEDYKETVATSAALCTMGQMLSGTLICKDIYKKGTSKGVDPVPFVGGIGMGILMLRYALMVDDPAMINVNLFGLTTNVAYTAIYCFYSPRLGDEIALMAKTAGIVGVFLAYAQLEHFEKVEFRYGIIVTVLLILLIASPLIHLKEIVRTKNTDILPFPLIFMGTIVASQWLLYGIIINNIFIIFQNAVNFGLGLLQLSLFLIYPSRPSSEKSQKREKEN